MRWSAVLGLFRGSSHLSLRVFVHMTSLSGLSDLRCETNKSSKCNKAFLVMVPPLVIAAGTWVNEILSAWAVSVTARDWWPLGRTGPA